MRQDLLLAKGDVNRVIEYRDGRREIDWAANTVLLTGRSAMARVLANDIGQSFGFFITAMIFGDGGTVDGVKKYVNANRNGLFGVTRLSKPVIATLDETVPAQVVLTSVVRFDEAVGVTLNEMALQMATGDLYSMTTFADLNKTSDMQLTYNWFNSFV